MFHRGLINQIMEYISYKHHTYNQTSKYMIDFKNDLYRTEWLELVFAGRNKAYGAYELRQHNAFTTIKALIVGSALMLTMLIVPLAYSRFFQFNLDTGIPVMEEPILRMVEFAAVPPLKEVEPAPPEAPKPAKKVPLQKLVPLKVVPAAVPTEEMLSVEDLKSKAIGQQTVVADPGNGGLNILESTPAGNSGNTTSKALGDEVVGLELLEAYPEFPGGQSAFSKYISRNLRYPMAARESEISGRVIVSFVIEKNGDLSHIKILRGIGGGCDEEAIRVLKESPPWSPGMQNGQKVRVAYTMPIFFQLAG